MRCAPFSLPAILLLAACASPRDVATATTAGPPIAIPTFRADDPRVGSAGFVGETLRLRQQVGDATFTLMAFAVGDTLTLGAMVKGSFRGEVHWTIGARELRLPFDAADPGAAVQVAVRGSDRTVTAQGAGFRGTAWTNVELPCAEWLPADSALQLEFVPANGAAVVLPGAGQHYVAGYAAK